MRKRKRHQPHSSILQLVCARKCKSQGQGRFLRATARRWCIRVNHCDRNDVYHSYFSLKFYFSLPPSALIYDLLSSARYNVLKRRCWRINVNHALDFYKEAYAVEEITKSQVTKRNCYRFDSGSYISKCGKLVWSIRELLTMIITLYCIIMIVFVCQLWSL